MNEENKNYIIQQLKSIWGNIENGVDEGYVVDELYELISEINGMIEED